MFKLTQTFVSTIFDSGFMPTHLLMLALLALVVWLLRLLNTPSDYEWINSRWLAQLLWTKQAHEYAEEGYFKINKAKRRPFKMTWWARENIFLPPEYLTDLKRANETSLSFLKNISDAFSLHYSVGDLYDGCNMINIIQKKLNTQLPSITPILADEAEYAIQIELECQSQWTSKNAADMISRIMHRMTSRVLICPEICRNETWIDVSLSFMNSVVITGLVPVRLPLGPLRGPFTSLLAVFHKRKLEKAISIVQPIVEARLQELREGATVPHQDAIQWAIELANDDSNTLEADPRRLTLNTLQNIWAGSAGPAVGVTQMIFQVLAMPEYLDPLRAEAEAAITDFGWTDKALHHMPLLDSFIRECNRLYPLGSITAARTIMDPRGFTFHDGLTLPQGTRLAFAIAAIQKDERYTEHAAQFDGFRFARRSSSEHTGPCEDHKNEKLYKSGASTITMNNLVFGFGKHACPGRFYAIRKTKIIFCKLVLNYDLKWTKAPKSGRPKEFPVEGQFAPNLEQEISFKSKAAETVQSC